MSNFASPDLPAYVCYGVVLLVTLFVARATVNELLAAQPDRWAFIGTWFLYLAYVLMPLGLFWLLDYTSALRDTSLFAALLVAVGYQQILAGGVQGITTPGQTSLFLKPFEAWVKRVADRIVTRNKEYLDHFEEGVRASLAKQANLAKFKDLVFAKSSDPTALAALLQPLMTDPPPPGATGRTIDTLWRDLRKSEPENYGYLLYKKGLVGRFAHWWRLDKGRSKAISAAVLLMPVLLAVVGYLFFGRGDGRRHLEAALVGYHQWRLLKPNASERDRWRSREFLAGQIAATERDLAAARDLDWQAAASGDTEEPGRAEARQVALRARLRAILTPLIAELRYPGVDGRNAGDILRLIVDRHSTTVDEEHVDVLIDSLRTTNEQVRLQIHQTLQALQAADYAAIDLPLDDKLTGSKWVPAKDESAATIDGYVALWRRWWEGRPRPAKGLVCEP